VVYDLLSNHNQIGNIMSSRMTATELATMWIHSSHKPQLEHLLLSCLPLAYCYVQLIIVLFFLLSHAGQSKSVKTAWITLPSLSPCPSLSPVNVTCLNPYWHLPMSPLFPFTVTNPSPPLSTGRPWTLKSSWNLVSPNWKQL
jgi:hypothetical protein